MSGTECEMDAFEIRSEHECSPSDCDAFAFGCNVIQFGTFEGEAKVSYRA